MMVDNENESFNTCLLLSSNGGGVAAHGATSRVAQQFIPLGFTADVSFWQEVGRFMIDEWRLSTPLVYMEGAAECAANRLYASDSSVIRLASPTIFCSDFVQTRNKICETKVSKTIEGAHHRFVGSFRTFATQQLFKEADRKVLVLESMQAMLMSLPHSFQQWTWNRFCDNPIAHLGTFVLLSFQDLKRHQVAFNFAMPILRPRPNDFHQAAPSLPAQLILPKNLLLQARRILLNKNVDTASPGLSGICLMKLNFNDDKRLLDDDDVQFRPLSDLRRPTDCLAGDLSSLGFANASSAISVLLSQSQRASNREQQPQASTHFRLSDDGLQTQGKVSADTFSSFESPIIVAFADTCILPNKLGSPIRSLLFLLAVQFELFSQVITILSHRDSEETNNRSQLFFIRVPPRSSFPLSTPMGPYLQWEQILNYCAHGWMRMPVSKNAELHLLSQSSAKKVSVSSPSSSSLEPNIDSEGKSDKIAKLKDSTVKSSQNTIFMTVNLKPFLDPIHIQQDAVNMNISLMKWRILPNLVPSNMSDLKVLILGMGTLGCSMALGLLGWGVRHFTLVDSGKVAYSNPTRQILYDVQDATEGNMKAEVAKKRLLSMRPDATVHAVTFEIPILGHRRFCNKQGEDESGEMSLASIHNILCSLIDSHDVMLLLLDTREARWLPSLIAASRDSNHKSVPTVAEHNILRPRLTMTVALAFDSFVVMRHSCGTQDGLACYFCNDMASPSDSTAFRTLDQQCTISRPGVASIASNVAVEIIAALSQHPKGFAAPHTATDCKENSENGSCLGSTPHVVRGRLSDFRLFSLFADRLANCICCSEAVVRAYKEAPMAFLRNALANPGVLEEISGLAAMKKVVERNVKDVLCFDFQSDFDA